MNRRIKSALVLVMTFSLMFTTAITVFASDTTANFDAEKYVADELNAWTQEHNIGVTFENVHIVPKDNMSDAEIEESVKSYVGMMKNALNNMSQKIVYPSMTRATGSYTAKVESMIPAIGWGYINQDFTANVSSSKISSVTLKGSSYDTGFTIGTWDPNYSWYDISSNKKYLQIHMKGTINYLWEALNITQDCTFLDTFKASGSTLVDALYSDWPD